MTGERETGDPPSLSPRRALVLLVIFAVAVVLAVILVQRLQESARMQDCLASGRTICAPIDIPSR